MDIGQADLFGYSRTGAQDYLNELNAQAIDETKDLLGDIEGIRTAVEENWQGQAALNFISNLQNAVTKTQDALEVIKDALNSEFAQIEEQIVEQDNQMVEVDE